MNEQTQLLESNNNNDNTQTDISVTDTNVISPSLAELEEQSGLQDYLATPPTTQETDPLLAANNKSPMQDLRIVILTMVMKMKMRESITMTIT